MLVITIMDSSFSVGGTRLSMEEYIVFMAGCWIQFEKVGGCLRMKKMVPLNLSWGVLISALA
jgi:hypothetical protein